MEDPALVGLDAAPTRAGRAPLGAFGGDLRLGFIVLSVFLPMELVVLFPKWRERYA